MSFELLTQDVLLGRIMCFFTRPELGRGLVKVNRQCRNAVAFRENLFKNRYKKDFPLDFARLEKINHFTDGLAVLSWEELYIKARRETIGDFRERQKALFDLYTERNLSGLEVLMSVILSEQNSADFDIFSGLFSSSLEPKTSDFADRTLPFQMPYFKFDACQFPTVYDFQDGLNKMDEMLASDMSQHPVDAEYFLTSIMLSQSLDKIKARYASVFGDAENLDEGVFEQALVVASQIGRVDVVSFLMEKSGLDVKTQTEKLYESVCKTNSNSALLGGAKVICTLINESKLEWRQDFLTHLCAVGASEAIEYVCSNIKDLNVNQPDSQGKVPLIESSLIGDVLALDVLCKAGATVDIQVTVSSEREDLLAFSGRPVTPLIVACADGHFASIKYLIEHGADINQSLGIFKSPLGLIGRAYIAKYLIEKGAQIDEKRILVSWCWMTPKEDAYLLPLVQLLLDKGCDPNSTREIKEWDDPDEPNTALYFACKNGHGDVARLLVERGADKSVLTPDQIEEHKLQDIKPAAGYGR